MAPLKSIEDSKWAEVKHINCYATFMGYLCMAMRGLGFLVVTWTTVVLLGGFVSTLEKKDFWCLTVITLVQTAGVFNIHVSENLTAVPKLCFGFLSTMKKTITREGGLVRRNEKPLMPCLPAPNGRFSVRARKLAALGVAFVQAMVFGMILCPLAALYGFGLHITTVISLWRLVEHDYGTSSEGDAANRNRKPAIYVLYVLAVFQGAVFCYRKILGFVGKRVAKQVAELYKFDQSASSSVMGYLDVVRIGCEKDPSFAKGRNLITYAAELMESESQSPDELLSGTRILDTLIKYDDNLTSTRDNDREKGKRMAVMRELLTGSSSSGKIVQKLLRALDSRSACDAEMKKLAARIVLRLAADIRLKHFPEAIESMYSLLDASQQKANGGFRELLHQGLLMVEKIVQNEENTGLIWTWQRTQWLSFGILWPVSSRLLHRVNHETWSEVVDAALQAMCSWLATARGQFSTSLRQYVSGNLEAIREMEYILTCPRCHEKRKILAMKVLITQLGGDQESKRNIIEQLLGIFLDYDKDGFTKELAGEKLVALTQESRINADIILQGDKYVGGIVIVLRTHRRYECRVIAAGILEGLCRHYVADDECFRDLKRLVTTDLMPEVLTLISGRHTHTSVYSEKKLQVALLSLWVMVYDKLIFTSQDLPPLFGKVASQDPDFNFARKIKELVRINSSIVPMEADCLRILRSVAKMVVSIIRMRHLHTYVHKRELEPILSSLQDAYRKMDELDGYLLLSGEYSTDTLTGMLFRAWAEFRRWTDPEDREPPNKGKEPEIIEVPGPSMVSHNPQAQLHLAATGEDREAAPNKGKELEIFEPSGAGHSMVSLAKSQFHYPPENAENRQAPTKGKESENAEAPGPSMVSLANAQFQYLPQNAENHQAPTKGKESENVETPWPSNMEQDQCSLC